MTKPLSKKEQKSKYKVILGMQPGESRFIPGVANTIRNALRHWEHRAGHGFKTKVEYDLNQGLGVRVWRIG